MLAIIIIALGPSIVFCRDYPELNWNFLDYIKALSEGRFKLIYFAVGMFGLLTVFRKKTLSPSDKFSGLLWIFFYLLIFAVAKMAIGRLVSVLSYSTPLPPILAASKLLGNLESSGLGFIPFALHDWLKNTWIEKAILICYLKFYYLLALAIFLTFKTNLKVARTYLFSLLLASAVGLVGWFLFPVIGPIMVYELPGRFPGVLSAELHQAYRTAIFSPESRGVISFLAEFWGVAKPNFNAISNFPSMHVAWALLVVFAVGRAYRGPLLWCVWAWFALIVVGTVYTFQHMSLDIFAGIIVAACSWWLAQYFVEKDTKANEHPFFTLFNRDSRSTDVNN